MTRPLHQLQRAGPVTKRRSGSSLAGANVRQYANWRRLLIPCVVFAMLAALAAVAIERASLDARFQTDMAAQQSMAGQLAFNAVQLAWDESGQIAAKLANLETSLSYVDEHLRLPANAIGGLVMQSPNLAPALADLRRAWSDLRIATSGVLAAEREVHVLRDLIQRFHSIVSGILVTNDELLDALVTADESGRQIHAAARQLMLIQRIATNLRRLLEGGLGVLSAADRLGRDAILFGDVTNALLHGNRALRIPVVESPEARDILQNLAREFRQSATLIEGVMSRADQIDIRSRAIEQVRHDHARVIAATAVSISAYQGGQPSLLLDVRIMASLAGVGLLALLAAMVYLYRHGRTGHREALWQAESYARLEEETRELQKEAERERLTLQAALTDLTTDVVAMGDGRFISSQYDSHELIAPLGRALRTTVGLCAQRLQAIVSLGGELNDASEDLHIALAELRGTSTRHVRGIEATAAATKAIARTIDELNNGIGKVNALTPRFTACAETVNQSMDDAVEHWRESLRVVRDTLGYVRQLGDSTHQVAALSELLEDIGEQSKMLALNVSIQASMDSESGRALANFADEVQRLSERARLATRRMTAANEALRNDVDSAIDSIKRADWRMAGVDAQAEQVTDAITSLRELTAELSAVDVSLANQHQHHTLQLTEVVKGVTAAHGAAGQFHVHSRRFDELSTEVSAIAAGLEAESSGLELQGKLVEPPDGFVATALDIEAALEPEILAEDNIQVLHPRRG